MVFRTMREFYYVMPVSVLTAMVKELINNSYVAPYSPSARYKLKRVSFSNERVISVYFREMTDEGTADYEAVYSVQGKSLSVSVNGISTNLVDLDTAEYIYHNMAKMVQKHCKLTASVKRMYPSMVPCDVVLAMLDGVLNKCQGLQIFSHSGDVIILKVLNGSLKGAYLFEYSGIEYRYSPGFMFWASNKDECINVDVTKKLIQAFDSICHI